MLSLSVSLECISLVQFNLQEYLNTSVMHFSTAQVIKVMTKGISLPEITHTHTLKVKRLKMISNSLIT